MTILLLSTYLKMLTGGNYIGGCDDGPTEEAPGLVPLSFTGKLQPMLYAAGAKGDVLLTD
jgi:hypothetical protein